MIHNMKPFNLLTNEKCVTTTHLKYLSLIGKSRYFKECKEVFNINESDKVITIFKHMLVIHQRSIGDSWILKLKKNYWFETFLSKIFI